MKLTEVKINSFLPLQKVLRHWHDRKKYVEEPLFPSYVFVYLTDMQSYYAGMEAEGSLNYVRIGKEIARVNDSVVEGLRLSVNRGKDLEVSEQRFQPGRKLSISQGPLTGLACEVISYNGKHKLLVRVDLLQRNILLAVPEDDLVSI